MMENNKKNKVGKKVLKILLVIFCIIVIAVAAVFIYFRMTYRQNDPAEGNYSYTTEDRSVSTDGGDIYGVLYKPEREGKVPIIIFAHELGMTHSSGEGYAKHFASNGLAAYIFDFRNGSTMSRSGNDMSLMSIDTERDDLLGILNEVKTWDFVDSERIILIGGSQGGYVATKVAAEHPEELAGLICIYPAYVIQDDIHEMFATWDDVPDSFEYRGWFTAGKCYAEAVWDYDVYDHMTEYGKPMLLIHGTDDALVDISYSDRAAETFPNATYHVIERAGHGFYGSSFSEAVIYMDQYLADIGIL